ncbi:hypothetical protein GCM10007094_41060 [Pseudovibrio japonicus]|uniref:DNA-binding protein n=1 Tax=Pseudovibrio japonicus TaxID=366534 RepID=A0ABQ3EPV8_9HYPH|nr:hypothetical protein [Pseudovibrio japonicus]GHB47558.1 hypothetical protein GCM10007094_41060 [Pseudovibrio japonicus]
MREHPPNDQLLSRTEVHTHFGLTQRFLEGAACKGGGPTFVKIGRSVRYRAGDVRVWIETRRIAPVPEVPKGRSAPKITSLDADWQTIGDLANALVAKIATLRAKEGGTNE